MKETASFGSPARPSLLAVAGKLTEIHYQQVTFLRHPALLVLIAVLGGACPNSSIISSAATKSNSTQTVASTAPAPELDPEAIATLDKMGAYLRTLKAYQVRATTTTEDVLDDGQKIQYDATTDMLVQMPDKMRVEHTGDRLHRLYLYDGKTFTIWAELVNYYATVPAPATIVELTDQLYEKYDLELPLEDLFYWGSARSRSVKLEGATDVGPTQVEGTTCEQYAFRQEGVDWQIWIQLGDYPLPRKIVITTLTDEARPQFTAVYTWNLAPSFNEAAFTFDPPKDAHRITLAVANAAAEKKE